MGALHQTFVTRFDWRLVTPFPLSPARFPAALLRFPGTPATLPRVAPLQVV
jgi:hypothetical protein